MKLLVVLLLMAIVASLGWGLFRLVKDDGEKKSMVNALTLRISLSVTLFVLLLLAWAFGLIEPNSNVPN